MVPHLVLVENGKSQHSCLQPALLGTQTVLPTKYVRFESCQSSSEKCVSTLCKTALIYSLHLIHMIYNETSTYLLHQLVT